MANDLSDLTLLYLMQELEKKNQKKALLTLCLIDNGCPIILNWYLYVIFA